MNARQSPCPGRRSCLRPLRHPAIETLEPRVLLSVVSLNAGIPDGAGGSLRAAISAANANFEDDTINLATGTYALTLAGRGEDGGSTGDLDITESGRRLTIRGAGAGATIIDAAGLDRAFHVRAGTTLVLENLTVTGGHAGGSTGAHPEDGGGILNAGGTLALSGVVVSANRADENGGGIHNDAGTMTINATTIRDNTAFAGAGILNSGGSATILDTTISGNTAQFRGGGLFSGAGGTVNITASTIRSNTASESGGGIDNNAALGLTNSTLSANRAFSGGGVLNAGTLTITHGTIHANVATNGFGGGILNGGIGTVTLGGSIIAGNTAALGNPDVRGAFTSQGSNLIGDKATATGLVNGVNGDRVGEPGAAIDPRLAPLQAIGGVTWTHVPLPGSPALDAVTNGSPTVDQRGRARPVDGDRDGTPRADIGAAEASPPRLVSPIPDRQVQVGGGTDQIDLAAVFAGGDLATGTPLTYTVTGNGNAGAIRADLIGSVLTLSAINAGSARITVRAIDSAGAFAEDVFQATVAAVNRPPAIQAPVTASVAEDHATPLHGISISDADAGAAAVTVTLSVPSGSLHVTPGLPGGLNVNEITGNDGTVVTLSGSMARINITLGDAGGPRYTPAANATAAQTLTIQVNDGGHTGSGGPRTATATILLSITPANDPPTARDDVFIGIAEDSTAHVLDVLANDTILPDIGEVLTITAVSAPDHGGNVTIGGVSTLLYFPAPNFVGTETFTYTINDGTPGSDASATVSVTVDAVNNDPPTARDDLFTNIAEDSLGNVLDVLANDTTLPDIGEPLVLIDVGVPDQGGAAGIVGGELHYTPAPDFFGTETFTYSINDGTPGSDATATVTVQVANTLDSPRITALNATTIPDGMRTVRLNASFVDIDHVGVVTARIDWGDGTFSHPTPVTTGLNGALAATHAYAEGGLFTVTLALGVLGGAVPDSTATTTAVAPGVGVRDGELQIIGTAANDRLRITLRRGAIHVRTNILSDRSHVVAEGAVDRILMLLQDGHDTASISRSLAQAAHADGGPGNDRIATGSGTSVLSGGDGNDRLRGGNADDRLDGGDGNDHLSGGHGDDVLSGGDGDDRMWGGDGDDDLDSGAGHDLLVGNLGDDLIQGGAGDDRIHGHAGRDLLIGGAGRDQLIGSTHDDILLAGTTTLDRTALRKVLDEWVSARPFSERVANLAGVGTGAGLNGDAVLTLDTVFNDGVHDRLSGGGRMFWLFADPIEDRVRGRLPVDSSPGNLAGILSLLTLVRSGGG